MSMNSFGSPMTVALAASSRRSARRVVASLVVLGGAVLLSGASRAAPAFGVRSGIYTEADAGFVGAEAIAPIAPSWSFDPNLEVAFADRGDRVTLSGDFEYDLERARAVRVWVGAGPALIVREDEPGAHRSDAGVNFIAGVGFRERTFTPYVQTKVPVADDSQLVLAFGVRF